MELIRPVGSGGPVPSGDITGARAFRSLLAAGLAARLSYSLARSPVLPLFAVYLGAGPEAVGLVVGISTVTGIFFKLPSGALSDIIGRRRTMLLGLLVFAAMPFAYFLVGDYRLLVLVRFLHGFATAIYGPVSMAMVADLAGGRKGEMLSWFSSITITGNLLGAPLGGYILHGLSGGGGPALGDFHRAYLASGLAGLFSLLIAVLFLKGEKNASAGQGLREASRRLASGVREVMGDRRVLVISGMEGIQNMSMGALEAFLPVYAVLEAGLNEFQAGLLWAVQVLAAVLSKPLMGRTSDRYGRRPLIASGMLLCALSFGAVPALKGFLPLLAAALLFGLGEALVTSSSAALVADVCRERHYGTAMGAFGTIFDIGHASGPILAGLLIARLDYLYSFWILSMAMALAVPAFVLAVRGGRPA